MKSQLNYKAKRNITIIVIIAILVVLASIGTYLFMKGNSETQAMSEVNGTSEDRAGEDYQVAQDNNDNQSENNNQENHNNEEESTDNDNETVENNDDNNATDNDNDEDETVTIAENNNNANNTNNNNNTNNQQNLQTQTQTITTTETVERTQRLVGFSTASIDYTGIGVNAEIPDLNSVAEAVTSVESNYVINGMKITYNVQLTSPETLSGINVSANIPEGTELVENSISDDGVVTDGKIYWKVDIDTEKVVSFKVNVTATSGDISFVATVNGKDTNTVTNVVDEAPVMDVVAQNKYQMEVGTEYVEKGYSAIDKEDGDITDKVELSYRFQAKDAPTWENPDPTELDTSRLGTYKITYTVTDSMGNTSKATRVVEIVDTQAPVISGLDDGEYVTKNEIVTITDATLDIVTINGVEQEFEGTEFQDKLTHEGTFVIVAIDKAGNRTEKTVSIDKTPAVKSATNILVLGDINENKVFYATIGDTIQAYVSFNEKLAHNPTFILINDGKEYTMDESLVTAQEPNKDGKYVYQILYKIEEDTTFVDGEITLRVTDLEDMYGNKIADETKPTNGHIVYFDTTPPMLGEGHPLYILNRDDAENRKYIANGEYLRVEANFSEELAEEPVLTIGSGENTQVAPLKSSNYSEASGNYVYVWDIKLDNSILKLEDGTIVPFTITNVVDKAGNTATFDNDDVTPYKDIYDQVTYDNTPAVYDTLGILNVTHYRQNDKEGASEDLTCATTGDEVRVLISFNEKLTVEPKVKINGNDELVYDMTFREDSSSDTVFYYMADFVIEEDMDLPEDEITFEVYGYEDVAGNESEKLDNSDINSDSYKKVVYDKTAPSAEISYSNDTTNPTKGNVTVTLSPKEEIKDLEDWTKNEDGTFTKEFEENGEYDVTIEDLAGNFAVVIFEVDGIDRTAPVITLLEDDTFEVGVDTYDYPEDITVTDNRDGNMPAEDVNIVWYYATPEGGKGEVAYSENFPWDTNLKGVVEPGTTYYIEYWIEDAAGNRGEAHRLLTFVDNTDPEITLDETEDIHFDTVEEAANFDVNANL